MLGLVWAHPWLPLKPLDSSRLSRGCMVLLSKAVGLPKTAVSASNLNCHEAAVHTMPSLHWPALPLHNPQKNSDKQTAQLHCTSICQPRHCLHV